MDGPYTNKLTGEKMKPFKLKINTRPEDKLSKSVEDMLKIRDWYVCRMHGNRNQIGFPDLYACHYVHGYRWIELKVGARFKFTNGQRYHFPRMLDNGTKISLMNFADMKVVMDPDTPRRSASIIRGQVRGNEVRPAAKQPRWGPEANIQAEIIEALHAEGWYVMETHGNQYQQGVPDLYATHKIHGPRWIEVKVKKGYSFTPAQKQDFPKMIGHGALIWILQGPDIEKLFKPANMWEFWK